MQFRNILFITALFCGLVSMSLAQSCNSPLAKTTANPNGIVTLLSAPKTVTGLNYCKSLEGKSSCCSAEEINALPEKFQAIMDA